MEFLLDTNALIWWYTQPERLSRRAYNTIEDPYNDIYYSPISLWEIAIKYAIGKLFLGGNTPEQFFDRLDEDSFTCLELLNGSLVTSYRLPLHHRDPFDRLLVWEALQHDYVLLSSDTTLKVYEPEGLRLVA